MDYFKIKLEATEIEILKILSESKNWEAKSIEKNLEQVVGKYSIRYNQEQR